LQLESFLLIVCPEGTSAWNAWFDSWSVDGKASLAAALTRCGVPDAATRLAVKIEADPDCSLLRQPVIPKPPNCSSSPEHEVTWRMLLEIVRRMSPDSESVEASPRSVSGSDEVEMSPSPRSTRGSVARQHTPERPINSASKSGAPPFCSAFAAHGSCVVEQLVCCRYVRSQQPRR
jgi:hypothetical protein